MHLVQDVMVRKRTGATFCSIRTFWERSVYWSSKDWVVISKSYCACRTWRGVCRWNRFWRATYWTAWFVSAAIANSTVSTPQKDETWPQKCKQGTLIREGLLKYVFLGRSLLTRQKPCTRPKWCQARIKCWMKSCTLVFTDYISIYLMNLMIFCTCNVELRSDTLSEFTYIFLNRRVTMHSCTCNRHIHRANWISLRWFSVEHE